MSLSPDPPTGPQCDHFVPSSVVRCQQPLGHTHWQHFAIHAGVTYLWGGADAAQRLRDAVAIEHAAQVQLLERLGLEWTPGEPFLAIVGDEIQRLRKDNALAANELVEYGKLIAAGGTPVQCSGKRLSLITRDPSHPRP